MLCIAKILFILFDKVEPEHFIFSTFGVLHVIPGGTNETQSLAEWMKEAVLYKAISSLPFFKNFLVKKSFDKYVFMTQNVVLKCYC